MSILGVNVYWHIPEFSIQVEKLNEALNAEGFESLANLSRKATVARAARSFQDRRHSEGRRVTEKVSDNGETITYGILDLERDGERADYTQQTKVSYHRSDNRVEVEGKLSEEVLGRIAEVSNQLTDNDLRLWLTQIVRKAYGQSKRPTGGFYFVPERQIAQIEAARRVVKSLGVGATVYVERIYDGEEERQAVVDSLSGDAGEVVRGLKSVVAGLKRRCGLKTQRENIAHYNGLLDAYQEILGASEILENLKQELLGAEIQIAEKLAGIANT